MQCSSMQGIYDQLTRGVHLPPLYIYSVMVFKASVLDSLGGLSPFFYIYKQCSMVCKASVFN